MTEPAVNQSPDEFLFDEGFHEIRADLERAISHYWAKAREILNAGEVALRAPASSRLSLETNFFSALFLYSYACCGIPSDRRIFYGTVNQCLRGMVTGCDNLLDDEYKKTLDTDLPEQGTRFRSVVDIMVSDRVLFELLTDEQRRGHLTSGQVDAVSTASLSALLQSGAQEASEEGGVAGILEPESVLRSIHHYKTGLLFQSPWAAPSVIETLERRQTAPIKEALYNIGIGCQILDDLVDFFTDLRRRRHNYVVSLVHHDACPRLGKRLRELGRQHHTGEQPDLRALFPDAVSAAVRQAESFLFEGTRRLYREEHGHLVRPTVKFLASRVGAGRFLQTPSP